MALGLPSWACGGGTSSEEKPEKIEQQKEYLHLKVDNAFDLMTLIGKDIKSLAIPEDAIEYIGAYPFAVNYDGNFLGYPCTNIFMAFSNDYATKIDSVKSITISFMQPTFMDCKAYLDKELGECYYSGTMPYVAVNGGAVTYFTYFKDGYKYHLKMASARSYCTLEVTKDEPKGAPRHEGIGMMPFQSFVPPKPAAPVSKPVATVDNREVWACVECGYPSNRGKFCGECGKPRKK